MKRILQVCTIIAAVLLAAAISLPFLIDANQFRPMLESTLSKALARDVKVGALKIALLSGGVTADDLSIADDPAYSRSPFVRTKSLTLGVDLWPLILSRRLHVTKLIIDQPRIELLQSGAGGWNISSLGGKSVSASNERASSSSGPGLDLSVKLFRITGGRLSIGQTQGSGRPAVLEDVNLQVRDFSSAAAFPFTLAGKAGGSGDIRIDGTAGPINPADAAQSPARLTVKVSGLELANALLTGDSGALSGLLAMDGSGSSNGRTIALHARVKIDRLKMAKNGSPAREPVQFDVSMEHDLRKRAGVLRRGLIHIGTATADLAGTYAQHGDSTVVDMTLSGTRMPAPQLAAMLPAMGIVLPAGSSLEGGTADARLALQGPVALLVTSGSVDLNNTRLAGFDLGSRVSAVARLAGVKAGPNTEIQTFGANLRMGPEGISARDIKLVAPAIGELTGNGTVSPDHALDFKMRAVLHTSGAVMAALGQKGDTGVPIVIEGTSSEPIFRPDVGSLVQDRLQHFDKGNPGKTAQGILEGVFGKKENRKK